ncbi:hypothetical protein ABC255_10695 [Neobacillus sp. 3P2-tot-E-2]
MPKQNNLVAASSVSKAEVPKAVSKIILGVTAGMILIIRRRLTGLGFP